MVAAMRRELTPQRGDGSIAPRWEQIGTSRSGRSWAWLLVAWALAALPLWVQAGRILYDRNVRTQIICVIGAELLLARAFPKATPVAALAAGVAMRWFVPDMPLATVAVIVALPAAWAVVSGAVEPALRAFPSRQLAVAAVPLFAADVLLVARPGLRVPAALIAVSAAPILYGLIRPVPLLTARPSAAASAATATTARRFLRTNARMMSRIGRPIGTAIGALVMTPVAVITAFVWAGNTITRFDPLAHSPRPSSRWVAREAGDPNPTSAFSGAHVADAAGASRSLHRLGATLVSAALVALVFVDWPSMLWTDKPIAKPAELCKADPDPAMDGQPGWPQSGCDTSHFSERLAFDPTTVYTFRDFRSETVNVHNGVRRTWQPPPCTCPRVRVWWFGGSSAWGFYHRDEFTIPSQLAKAAWAHGVALEITNYAMPGWVLGQEVRKFAQLTTTEPPPDVAIFYDGGNDLRQQDDRNHLDRGDDESETAFNEVGISEFFETRPTAANAHPEPRITVPGRPPFPQSAIADHAMNRYVRGVRLANQVGAANSTKVIFVWQPLASTAPEAASNPGSISDGQRPAWVELSEAAAKRLPPAAIDLSDSLDEVDRPVFKDLFHTNELASDIIAKQLWTRAESTIRAAPAG